MIIPRFTHVAVNHIISFFLRLNNVPLYIYVCVCVCVYLLHLIHSSVDGHLHSFHVLAASAAMNVGVHVSF